jgi:hypothetical protein
MSKKQKIIVVNVGVLVALTYQYLKGINLFVVVMAGIFSFIILNAIVMMVLRPRA